MTTFTVTTLNDVVDANDNQTSLREALAQADASAGADVISFGTLAGTVTLNNALGALQINSDVSISGDTTGDGKADITIDGNRGGPGIAAADMHRVITVNSGSTSTLDALTITGGREYTMGGGIYVASGANLSLKNSTVTGNYVSGQEVLTVGGVPSASNAMGAGIANDGILVIQNSTISGNGAGAGELKSAYGGGIYNTNFLSMTNVTVANNYIEGGVAEVNLATHVVVTPAGVAQGAGVANVGSGSLTMTNVTVTGNEAWQKADGPANGLVTGVFSGGSSAITITDSIILGNGGRLGAATSQAVETSGLLTANGLNIIGLGSDIDATDHIIQVARIDRVFDVVAINLNTQVVGGVLANNGGKVNTVALDPFRNNPALDAASSTAGVTDARGQSAHDDANIANRDTSARDLGAFEQDHDSVNNAPPTMAGTLTATVTEGGSAAITRSNIYFSDADNLGPDISFTVSNLRHVRFLMDGAPVTNFLAGDLIFGHFEIIHDGSEGAAAGFDIAVEDLDEDHSMPLPVTFNVNVNLTNDAPVVVQRIPNAIVSNRDAISVSVKDYFSDVDSPVLTYSATLANGAALPTWLKLVKGVVLTGKAPDSFGQELDIKVAVSDGSKTVSDTFHLSVPAGVVPNPTSGATNGANTISGKASSDTISAGGGNDTVNSGAGNDNVFGGSGNDRINGGTGNDRLDGDAGVDQIVGGDGDDQLWGGDGSDGLDGQAGRDRVFGNGGNDRLDGGLGVDTLGGGAGVDTFEFDVRQGNKSMDTIIDFFTSGVRDRIKIETSFKLTAGMFVFGTKALDANDHVIINNANHTIAYDADGSGAGKAFNMFTLDNSLTGDLDISYFVI